MRVTIPEALVAQLQVVADDHDTTLRKVIMAALSNIAESPEDATFLLMPEDDWGL